MGASYFGPRRPGHSPAVCRDGDMDVAAVGAAGISLFVNNLRAPRAGSAQGVPGSGGSNGASEVSGTESSDWTPDFRAFNLTRLGGGMPGTQGRVVTADLDAGACLPT